MVLRLDNRTAWSQTKTKVFLVTRLLRNRSNHSIEMDAKVGKCVSLKPYGQGEIPRVGLGTFTVFGQRVSKLFLFVS